MIENATLNGIAAPVAKDKSGGVDYPATTAFAARCCVGSPTRAQVITLGAIIKNASAVIYLRKPAIGAFVPATRQRITVTIDGSAPVSYIIEHVVNWSHGWRDYWELFVRGV